MDKIDVEYRTIMAFNNTRAFLANPPLWFWRMIIALGLLSMLMAIRGAKMCHCECHTQDGIPREQECL